MMDGVAKHPIRRLFEGWIAFTNSLGTVWIFFLMILIDADVIGRAGFNAPLQGVEEIVSFSIVGIFFLQLAHTLKSGRMTRNTIVIEYVAQRAPRALHLLEGVLNTVGAIMFALLTWAIAPFVYKAWVTGDYYGYLAIFTFPVWPIKALILIGSAATALQYAIEAISAFHTAADPDFDDGSSKEREFERDAYE